MKSRSVGSASSPRASLLSLALGALVAGLAAAAQAQDSAQPAAETLDTVVVADDRRVGLSLTAAM